MSVKIKKIGIILFLVISLVLTNFTFLGIDFRIETYAEGSNSEAGSESEQLLLAAEETTDTEVAEESTPGTDSPEQAEELSLTASEDNPAEDAGSDSNQVEEDSSFDTSENNADNAPVSLAEEETDASPEIAAGEFEAIDELPEEEASGESALLETASLESSDISEAGEPAAEENTKEAVSEDLSAGEADGKSETEALEEEAETRSLAEEIKEDAQIMLMGAFLMGKRGNPPVEVANYDELKQAITDAGDTATTILVTKSFELKGTLTIKAGQTITLTANNQKAADVAWNPIEQPADYANEGEEKQREIIEEARRRGEEALEKADEALPSEANGAVILKRAANLINNSLFKVFGKLTLGTEDKALYIDDNKEVRTAISDGGVVFDVGNGGDLTMKNATVMNVDNLRGYTGPIEVQSGGTFTMEGGRITHNSSYDQGGQRPTSAGGVYVNPGGTFTMNNGIIDNNRGSAGAVFVGDLFGSNKAPATINMNGGIIAKNKAITGYAMGGGISGFPKSTININDGIIAGNENRWGVGGGISVTDQFIYKFSNAINREYANTYGDYEKHLLENKAEANLNGGLIYDNAAKNGGGLYIDSNHANFNKTMILDNRTTYGGDAGFGGGVYVSFPPRVQKLENLLITDNKAEFRGVGGLGQSGNGGGLWNCPTGYVHIGDGHTVYIYGNEADSYGDDLTFSKKTGYFKLDGKDIDGRFYSHVSPVTEGGNIIRYLNDGPSASAIPEEMSYTNNFVYLRAEYNKKLIEEAWKNAKTFILGNKANLGGGFGSNANLVTPQDEGDYDLKFKKKWDESITSNPEYKEPGKNPLNKTITVDIFIVPEDVDADYVRSSYGIDKRLYKYGEVDLNKGNNWESLFSESKFSNLDNSLLAPYDELPAAKDNGLPFTPQELAARGYKYLVMERGGEFYSEVEEILPSLDQDVEAGVLEVKRIRSKVISSYDFDLDREQNIFLYLQKDNRLAMLDRTKLNEENDWTSTLLSPELMKSISKIEYYGEDRIFTEYGKWWGYDYRGYHVKDNGYAFVLTENTDGTLTLEIPYLWIQAWDKNTNKSGFAAEQKDVSQTITREGNKFHQFIITNYGYTKAAIEKVWQTALPKEEIPEQVDAYLLLDGERIIDGYDKDGQAIYRMITIRKQDGWKAEVDKLNPYYLAAGRYSLEEEDSIDFIGFSEWINNAKSTVKFMIDYASNYQEIDSEPGYVTAIPEGSDFHPYLGNVNLNLYLDGKKIDTQQFTWEETEHPVTGALFYDFNDKVQFEVENLNLRGFDLKIDSYDVHTNEPGLTEYAFYIQKDERGVYTLYVPRLMKDGVPYELFEVKNSQANQYDIHEKYEGYIPVASTIGQDYIKLTNCPKPTHTIDIKKVWKAEGNEDKIPATLKITVTDKDGIEKVIELNPAEDWTAQLESLKGSLSDKQYKFVEEAVENFKGEFAYKYSLSANYKDEKGENHKLELSGAELTKALQSKNYRYELTQALEFEANMTAEEIAQLIKDSIKVVENADGSYTIRYPLNITLAELVGVQLANTYEPAEKPKKPEDPEKPDPHDPPEPHNPPEKPVTPPSTPPVTPPMLPKSPAKRKLSSVPTKAFIQFLPPTATAQMAKGRVTELAENGEDFPAESKAENAFGEMRGNNCLLLTN